MSSESTDTGDNNTTAAGRIGRIIFILFVLLLVMWGLGKIIGLLPFFDSGNSGRGGGRDTGAAGPLQTHAAHKALLTNGGPTTAAAARAAVRQLVQIQDTIDTLSYEDQAMAKAQRNKLAREVMEARIKAYLAAPQNKKLAELDRQIRQDELIRQAWMAAGSTAAASIAGQGFPGGPNGWFDDGETGGSDDDLARHWKSFLDRTTPEQRARYNEYLRAMEVRRQQRGLAR